MIAAQLSDHDLEVLSDAAASSATTSSAPSAGGAGSGGGGLLPFVRARGADVEMTVAQDAAGVWYAEVPVKVDKADSSNVADKEVEEIKTKKKKHAARANEGFDTGGWVTVSGGGSSTPSSSSSSSSSAIPAAPAADDAAQASAAFTALRPYLPCGFFVPLPVLAASLPPELQALYLPERGKGSAAAAAGAAAASPRHLFGLLARMRPQEVDVRVFGDNLCDVFVRGVCENLDFDDTLDVGDARHGRYDYAPLAGALYAALQGKGKVSIVDLTRMLPTDILFRLPLRGYHCILIFERMPHLFFVHAQKYIVEARSFDDESAKVVTSLLVRTSPCPTELRYVVAKLTQPCPLQIVERELPKDMRARIRGLFASLRDFVTAHSAYLFVDGDPPILCSHKLLQAQWDRRAIEAEGRSSAASSSSSSSDGGRDHRAQRAAAVEIANHLPDGNGISVPALRRRLPSELDAFVYKKHPANFFNLFPDLFYVFLLYAAPNTIYVQHAAFPPPSNAIPKVRTPADCIRVVAVMTLKPRRLDIVYMRLPADARHMVDRFGGLAEFVQSKYKRVFLLFEDKHTGEPSAMYVGHLSEEKRESARRKLTR